jgi:hypothetical protein
LADGTYTAQATQSDEAGNTGASEPVTFMVDTTAPVVAITVPANHAFVNSQEPTLSGSAGNAGGDDPSVTLSIYAGPSVFATPEQTLAVNRKGTTSWTTGSSGLKLADGEYTAQVTQTDTAGNTGTSLPVTFTVKTTDPELTLNAPPSFIASATPSFSGSAATVNTKPTVTLKIYDGTATGGKLAEPPVKVSQSGGRWSTGPVQPLPDGTYTAQAEQADDAENTGHSHASTFTIDTIPPHVTMTFPATGSTTSGESQPVRGAAGTEPGDKAGITVKLFAGPAIGVEPVQELRVFASNGSWKATFGGLSPGTYTARAEQVDDAGNIGTSGLVTFTVEPLPTITPKATSPSPTITPEAVSPSAPPVASFEWVPSAPKTGESISLVSSSTDAASPIVAFAWALTSADSFQAGGPVLSTSFSTPGDHVVRLRVTNAAGLASIATETIHVATPQASLMQPFPVVRIAGTDTARGVKLRLLTVQAPAMARITVACRGHGCPAKKESRVARSSKLGVAVVTFPRFQRSLRAGVILEIRVSKPGEIGKYTRFVVRRGKLPERVDLCLQSDGVKPMVCPS